MEREGLEVSENYAGTDIFEEFSTLDFFVGAKTKISAN